MRHWPNVLIAAVLVCGSIAWFCQRRALLQLRHHIAVAEVQNAVARPGSAAAHSPPERGSTLPPSGELLRLRGEISALRRELNESDPLEWARREYSNDWQTVYAGPRPSQQPGFLYTTNLVRSGFATPVDSFQTFNYTLNLRKPALSDSEMMELWDVPDDYDKAPGYNIDLGEGHYGGIGYRIVNSERTSTNVVRLTVDYEREDGSSYRREKVLVERNGRWRMQPAGLTRAHGESEP